jgi:hypothetical protein
MPCFRGGGTLLSAYYSLVAPQIKVVMAVQRGLPKTLRPAGDIWLHAEPECAKIERVYERIDDANRIALVNPDIKAFR